MNTEEVLLQARAGRLYPGVILHGGNPDERARLAVTLALALLCEAPAPLRPCGSCRHCRRIGHHGEGAWFHPDFLVLEPDTKTATSTEAMRAMLRHIQVRPFEARGQVFAITRAETLTDGAANALLKSLEEPPASAPRHFLLACPAASDLLATLRTRCLALYLGGAATLDPAAQERRDALVAAVVEHLRLVAGAKGGLALGLLSGTLASAVSFDDPRSEEPFIELASALVRASASPELPRPLRAGVLELAAALLEAPEWRQRGVPGGRLVDGLASRCLAGVRTVTEDARPEKVTHQVTEKITEKE